MHLINDLLFRHESYDFRMLAESSCNYVAETFKNKRIYSSKIVASIIADDVKKLMAQDHYVVHLGIIEATYNVFYVDFFTITEVFAL